MIAWAGFTPEAVDDSLLATRARSTSPTFSTFYAIEFTHPARSLTSVGKQHRRAQHQVAADGQSCGWPAGTKYGRLAAHCLSIFTRKELGSCILTSPRSESCHSSPLPPAVVVPLVVVLIFGLLRATEVVLVDERTDIAS
jgi:hypothetical protein